VAIISAANPEATCCWVTEIRPWQPTKNSEPASAAAPHSAALGAGASRSRAPANRIVPAARQQAARASIGGNTSTMRQVAR
jgi:hypothetical protein